MRPRRVRITSEDSELAGQPRSSARRSALRRTLPAIRWPLAIVGVLAVGACVLSVVNIHLLVDTDGVLQWLTPRLSATLNRDVDVADAHVSVLPRPSIRLQGIRVENLDDFDGPALAEVDRARLDVAWIPLLVGRVRVQRISVDGARIYMAVDETGTTNYGDLVPEARRSAPTGSGTPLALGVGRIDIDNVDLTYFDAPRQRSFAVTGGRGRALLTADAQDGWRGAFELSSDSLQLRAADLTEEISRMPGPSAAATIRGDGSLTWVQIEEGRVDLAGESLALTGRIDGTRGSSLAYDLHLTNDGLGAAALSAIVPSGERSRLLPHFDGTLGVALRLRGPSAQGRPALSGALVLRDVSVRLSGEPVVDHVNGMVAFTPETIALDSIAGTFAGGPLRLSGAIGREHRALVLGVHAQPDLDRLDRMGLLPTGTTVSGNAVLDLSVAGPLGAPDSIQVVGEARLEGAQAKSTRFGVPLYVAAGDLTFVGQDVSWADLSILVGRDELTTSGTLRRALAMWSAEPEEPEIDASLAGARLDLGAVLPDPADAPGETYPRIAFAHLGSRPVDGRPASVVAAERGFSRPDRLPLAGSIRMDVDTLRYRGRELGSVSGRVVFADSALAIEDAAFEAWNGRAQASLRLGIGQLANEPFELHLSVADADAQPFLSSMTPIDSAISGKLTLDLDLAGVTDTSLLPVGKRLSGHASLAIDDGSVKGTGMNMAVADFLDAEAWQEIPFSKWTLDIQIEETVMEILHADLSGDLGEVAFTGMLDLGGSSDLSVGLSIPPARLQEVSLRRTGIGQSVLDQLRAVGSPLDLGLQVSGPIYAPTLEPDASHAVVLARR